MSGQNFDSIFIKIEGLGISFIVGGYYRHCIQNTTDKISFISKLEEHLSHKLLQKTNLILAGDFNIDLIKSSVDNDALFFLNTLLSHGLECHIFKPTRIVNYKNSIEIKSATLIDQIASNLYKYESTSGNIHYPNSDHCASYVIFKKFFNITKNKRPEKFYRNFKQVDVENLNIDCTNVDWHSKVFNEPNIDICFGNISKEIEILLELHAPLIKMSNRKIKYCNKPYIDSELIRQIRLRIVLFGIKKENPNSVNIENHRQQKNKVTNMCRKKRKDYFKKYFETHRYCTGKMWNGINLALEQCRAKKSLPNVVNDLNNNPLTSPKKIANSFMQYFRDTPSNTLKKIKPERFWYMDYFKFKKANDRYLVLNDCDSDEIEKHIKDLKNKSSSGPSSIPNIFLKMIYFHSFRMCHQ